GHHVVRAAGPDAFRATAGSDCRGRRRDGRHHRVRPERALALCEVGPSSRARLSPQTTGRRAGAPTRLGDRGHHVVRPAAGDALRAAPASDPVRPADGAAPGPAALGGSASRAAGGAREAVARATRRRTTFYRRDPSHGPAAGGGGGAGAGGAIGAIGLL